MLYTLQIPRTFDTGRSYLPWFDGLGKMSCSDHVTVHLSVCEKNLSDTGRVKHYTALD